MKKLFLIDGAAGTGKTDLVDFVRQKYPDKAYVIPKYTTRPIREKEIKKDLDLFFVSSEDFSRIKNNSLDFYSYTYGNTETGEHEYGIDKNDILNSIEKYEFSILIIRNINTIENIKKDFCELAFVVPLFIYTDQNLVIERLKKDGYTDSQIEFRLSRSKSCWDDYLENDYLETPTIINSSVVTEFHRKINRLFNSSLIKEKENYLYINPSLKYPIIKPLLGYRETMKKKLSEFPFEKNIFLMMKFRKYNEDVYHFIKDELAKFHYNCVRADDENWNITNTTFNPMAAIYCCKYGIALFDEAEEGANYSPNVAYELGMMQSQDKDCLILRHASLPDAPFDVVKDLQKIYSRDFALKEIVGKWISSLK